MKTRNICIIAVLFFISLNTNAQRFKGGILVGMNASQIDGDSWSGFYKTGLLAGAFVFTEFQDKFGAQLEIKYSGKGAAPQKDSYDYPKKVRLNYIDVPVLGTFKPIEHLKLEAGLSINYLFKAEYYDGAWFNYGDDGPNPFEAAVVIGLNYTFFTRFDLNVRWNSSLVPIRGEYTGATFVDGAWSNHVINFALYFHLGNRDS